MEKEWILTDPDTEQYGRCTGMFRWQYKQPDINGGEPVTIHLRDYTIDRIEGAINGYGYTLECNGQYKHNIYQEYGADAIQIMCECLFEMEERPDQ